ncbi:hypothetical protein D9M73_274410 [compost metagenome]
MGNAHLQVAVRQLQAEQLVVAVVGADLAFDDHPGIIALGQGQIEAGEGGGDRAAGLDLALFQ